MTKRRRIQTPPEFAALIERAKASAVASEPRKHHLVPAFYLRRWAENDVVRATDLDTRNTHVSNPSKMARETDFYRFDEAGLDPEEFPPQLVETLLSQAEGWAAEVIDHLAEMNAEVDPVQIAQMALFLGIQYTRGHAYRAARNTLANEMFKVQYTNMTDLGIREEIRRRGGEPTDELVAQSKELFAQIRSGQASMVHGRASHAGHAMNDAYELGECLTHRIWVVYKTAPLLVTSDEPVVTIPGPPDERDVRGGIATAPVIVYPLQPDRLLVLMHENFAAFHGYNQSDGIIIHDRLDTMETAEISREILLHAHRWAFERPSRQRALAFNIPQTVGGSRFEDVVTDPDGKTLVRFYKTTRARHSPVRHPWPVDRWWSRTRPAGFSLP